MNPGVTETRGRTRSLGAGQAALLGMVSGTANPPGPRQLPAVLRRRNGSVGTPL